MNTGNNGKVEYGDVGSISHSVKSINFRQYSIIPCELDCGINAKCSAPIY